ncbi:MAG: hypothetical protein AAF484_17130 [Pseudomonadota bacterium]
MIALSAKQVWRFVASAGFADCDLKPIMQLNEEPYSYLNDSTIAGVLAGKFLP